MCQCDDGFQANGAVCEGMLAISHTTIRSMTIHVWYIRMVKRNVCVLLIVCNSFCVPSSDIDECADGGIGFTYCTQLCNNFPGSYNCSCNENDGFALYTEPGAQGFELPPNENGLIFGDTFLINHTCVRKYDCLLPHVALILCDVYCT